MLEELGFSPPHPSDRELQMYAVIAIHQPEHVEGFLAFMARVEAVAGDVHPVG